MMCCGGDIREERNEAKINHFYETVMINIFILFLKSMDFDRLIGNHSKVGPSM